MKRIRIHPETPQLRLLGPAIDALRGGGLVVYPTDSVYGLGCDLLDKNAVEKIYRIKGNDKRKILSFICRDLKNISEYAYVPNEAYKVMRHLLPGPYTFLLGATRQVPRILLEKRKTVGIRVPDHPVCQALLDGLGHPVISTSASLPGGSYLSDPDEIESAFGHLVDIFLDTGPGGLEPSTIIDFTGDEPVIVRQGLGRI
ncbi:MAG: threonylcarbamoyl-AMP synthase [Acidobacteria bacterium]|nr:threonylcarbamoyl-AMP synthase [Acidobacteriota bacterium]